MGKKSEKERVKEIIEKYDRRQNEVVILSEEVFTTEAQEMLQARIKTLNDSLDFELKLIDEEIRRKRTRFKFKIWVILAVLAVLVGVLKFYKSIKELWHGY